jgi:hypothetical protein
VCKLWALNGVGGRALCEPWQLTMSRSSPGKMRGPGSPTNAAGGCLSSAFTRCSQKRIGYRLNSSSTT